MSCHLLLWMRLPHNCDFFLSIQISIHGCVYKQTNKQNSLIVFYNKIFLQNNSWKTESSFKETIYPEV